jgi:hypothetical protein
MTTKHTPGPWADGGTYGGMLEHGLTRAIFSRANPGVLIGGVYGDVPGGDAAANARLVAAAPEMFDLLERLAEVGNYNTADQKAAKALLARIRGAA